MYIKLKLLILDRSGLHHVVGDPRAISDPNLSKTLHLFFIIELKLFFWPKRGLKDKGFQKHSRVHGPS